LIASILLQLHPSIRVQPLPTSSPALMMMRLAVIAALVSSAVAFAPHRSPAVPASSRVCARRAVITAYGGAFVGAPAARLSRASAFGGSRVMAAPARRAPLARGSMKMVFGLGPAEIAVIVAVGPSIPAVLSSHSLTKRFAYE